jgi:hypothetical protein
MSLGSALSSWNWKRVAIYYWKMDGYSWVEESERVLLVLVALLRRLPEAVPDGGVRRLER